MNDSFPLQPGQWCLIHAAAGGTGQLLVQMATRAGANVVATCSTIAKAAIASSRGASCVLTTEDRDPDYSSWMPAAVRRLIREASTAATAPAVSLYGGRPLDGGVHVVYDSVGLTTAMASLDSLRPRGHAVFFGNASGAPPPIAPLLLSAKGSLTVTRPKLHDFLATREELLERSAAVFAMMVEPEGGTAAAAAGGATPPAPVGWGHTRRLEVAVQEVIPLDEQGARRGHAMIEGRQTIGKVLFAINDEVR